MSAPDDEALRRDVMLARQMGFNGVRKHQKIEDPRYLYWADRVGLAVWAEMPSAYRFTNESVDRLIREWSEVIARDYSHPCIIAWVPINESWGVPNLPDNPSERHYVRALYHLTDRLDPVVIDSAVTHQHAGGEYVARRYESEEAARLLGVARLRDIAIDALPRLAALPPLLTRRARHIVTENDRVRRARSALLAGHLATLGDLFNASHASMRDDCEVSVAAVDRLVELATSQRGVFGARLTGGGFGGAVVIAAAGGSASDVASEVQAAYAVEAGRQVTILVPARTT